MVANSREHRLCSKLVLQGLRPKKQAGNRVAEVAGEVYLRTWRLQGTPNGHDLQKLIAAQLDLLPHNPQETER